MPVLSNWMPLQSSPTKNWQGIATSESGQYIAAVAYNGGACQINGGGIFINTNWGTGSWSSTLINNPWSSITISATGQFIYACGYNLNCQEHMSLGGIYGNQNYSFGNWDTLNNTNSPWTGITTSANGKYVFACTNGENIYFSDNFGNNTWSQTNQAFNCIYVATSSDGKYLFVADAAGALYVNDNFGLGSFRQLSSVPIANWTSVAISSSSDDPYIAAASNSGEIYTYFYLNSITLESNAPQLNWQAITTSNQYVVAASYSGEIYINTNYGAGSWSQSSAYSVGQIWVALTASANSSSVGSPPYIFACSSESSIFTPILYGSTIVLTSAPTGDWNTITSSCSMKYVYAAIVNGFIYRSTSFGNDWTTLTAAVNGWQSITCSCNGQFVAAVSSGIFLSSNYGVSWNAPLISSKSFSVIRCSKDCQYIVTSGNQIGIYISSNYGSNWSNIIYFESNQINSLAISSTGMYVYAAALDDGGIYTNNNFGNGKWNETVKIKGYYQGIACSSDGTVVMTVANGANENGGTAPPGGVLVSTNRGMTWVNTSVCDGCTSKIWQACDISSNGSTMVAVSYGGGAPYIGGVYVSTNYGIDWFLKYSLEAGGYWQSVTISSDGSYLAFITTDGVNQLSGGTSVYVTAHSSQKPTIQPTMGFNQTIVGVCLDANSIIVFTFRRSLIAITVAIVLFAIALQHIRSKNLNLINFGVVNTIFGLGMLTIDLSTDILLVFLLFSHDNLLPLKYESIGIILGVFLLLLRVLHPIANIFLIRDYLNSTEKYEMLLDKAHMSNNSKFYGALLCLSLFEPTTIKFLPWAETEYCRASGGFPNVYYFKICCYVKIVQSIFSSTTQIVLLANIYLGNNCGAFVLTSVISTVIVSVMTIFEILIQGKLSTKNGIVETDGRLTELKRKSSVHIRRITSTCSDNKEEIDETETENPLTNKLIV